MGDGRHGLRVEDWKTGITQGLGENDPGLLGKCSLEVVRIGGVDKRRLDAEALHGVGQQVV